jgi:hypothetical protein
LAKISELVFAFQMLKIPLKYLYGKLFQNSFHFPNISYPNGFSDATPPVTLFKAKHKTLLKTRTVFTKHFSKNKTQCYKN